MAGKIGRYEGSSEPDGNSFRKKKRKIFKRTKISALGKERRMAKILIVDDAAFMRMMLKDIVVKAGHEVAAEAYDGNEALENIKSLNQTL